MCEQRLLHSLLHTTPLHRVGLGIHGQVVGVVAEEGEEVPVHRLLQGRLSKGGTKDLPLCLGHLRTQSWTVRHQDQYHHRWA